MSWKMLQCDQLFYINKVAGPSIHVARRTRLLHFTHFDMGNRAAGEILGVSKIKNGNRMATTDLDRLCIVYRPTEGKATVGISPKNGGDW